MKQGQLYALPEKSRRRGRLEATRTGGTNRGHAVDGDSRRSEVRGECMSRSVMERAA